MFYTGGATSLREAKQPAPNQTAHAVAFRHAHSFCAYGYYSHGSSGKESACNAGDAGDVGSIPGLGRSPGGGNGNPLQNFCLENPMDRGAWQATVHVVTKSQTQLSD